MIKSYHMYDARALATAYMVGILQIIAARQRAINALGAGEVGGALGVL
jgi:hypothetical protein